jgi:hypothetical protein
MLPVLYVLFEDAKMIGILFGLCLGGTIAIVTWKVCSAIYRVYFDDDY